MLLINLTAVSVQDLKLPVVGSQIVGLIPLKALLDSADFYIRRDGLFIVEEEHKIRLVRIHSSWLVVFYSELLKDGSVIFICAQVISKLGLDSLGPFNPKERIIE